MKKKNKRLEVLKMLISSTELGSQEEVLQAMKKEGYLVTQATISRDLKQLKIAKAAGLKGKYVYVLPNDTIYRRVEKPVFPSEMTQIPGFKSIRFSGNMAVIKTRPGYASSIAFDIDANSFPDFLGTIAGNDTIFVVLKEDYVQSFVLEELRNVIPLGLDTV